MQHQNIQSLQKVLPKSRTRSIVIKLPIGRMVSQVALFDLRASVRPAWAAPTNSAMRRWCFGGSRRRWAKKNAYAETSINRSPSLLEPHGTSVSWTCSETCKDQANLVEEFPATRPSSWSPWCCPTYQAAHGQAVSHQPCSTSFRMCFRTTM